MHALAAFAQLVGDVFQFLCQRLVLTSDALDLKRSAVNSTQLLCRCGVRKAFYLFRCFFELITQPHRLGGRRASVTLTGFHLLHERLALASPLVDDLVEALLLLLQRAGDRVGLEEASFEQVRSRSLF